MRLVINTNVILVSVSPKSKYHWIFQALKSERFDLLVTNDILLEYQEILEKKYSTSAAKLLLGTLDVLPNVHEITPNFYWNLIIQDPDDDKFVDCAISGNADHLVSEDSDFNILKSIDFPTVSVLNIQEFKEILKKS
ncbi:MAG: putative toxin-antitoxin system toxin component, PIN family [Thermodesulfobacteriota bacterium]